MAKYIFVTGGVVSSLGKGICAASIGRLLKNRGLKVFMQKFDPYINVDPGTMSPYQHGEVYVTDDGAETDLDLGHYERFIDERLTKDSNITSGKVFSSVIEKERRGDYLGSTVQIIPHVTNEIKAKLADAAKASNADVIITEIGGTVGDIESQSFLEAIRQWRNDVGVENTFYIHNTLVPYLKVSNEVKTKPTQHSVKELRAIGIQPDMIVLRTEVEITEEMKEKISLFCNVKKEAVVEAVDQEIIYEVANSLHSQKVDKYICDYFKLDTKEPDMTEWNDIIDRIKHLDGVVRIALVGKYVKLHDAYLSVTEALKHAGYQVLKKIEIDWILADDINESNYEDILKGHDGILVPGGFGLRATEGKMLAIKYAREHNVPFLGICLGMQLCAIEFARNVLGLTDATSMEFDEDNVSKNHIVTILEDKSNVKNLGGTLRLGLYDCSLNENSLSYKCYKTKNIQERHRHRYEFNNKYIDIFERNNMKIAGINPERGLVEILEYTPNDFFVACQFHPEFLSRPNRSHPLFQGFINASLEKSKKTI
ncbi:cTP synthase [Coprobacillus sp. CAG:698]|nr:cTP synthase [Coprobacillus sp. CAG:698]